MCIRDRLTYNGEALEYDTDGNLTYGPVNGELLSGNASLTQFCITAGAGQSGEVYGALRFDAVKRAVFGNELAPYVAELLSYIPGPMGSLASMAGTGAI